jgi:NAD(P)-dependent dehydrogenase (short-subunit alcohol dehydrogenase family)
MKEEGMGSLKGKTVLLTGATKGIGRAIALRLARDGAQLALCGRDRGDLDSLIGDVTDLGAPQPATKRFDVRDEEALIDFYRETRERFGPPDVLINNAGFNSRKAPLWEVETGEFDDIIAVNLRAPFILMRESFPDMKERGSGHVVNILSTVCHFSNETMGAYTAAKVGLKGLTDIYRKEVRPFNIKVTSIYPGGVDTPFRKAERPDYLRPESVAEAVYAALTLPKDLVVHHFTFRPMVETNF